MKTRSIINILCAGLAFAGLLSCNGSGNNPVDPPGPYKLSYGDSIIYMRAAVGDYIVYPTSRKDGVYSGFPEGIEIDAITGAINVSKSETGLRYKITHTATDGTVTTAMVVLSGITFTDHFFRLSQGDSIAPPVYNANISRILPLSGSSFDEGNIANGGGCSVKTDNGKINLAESVRNGVFGNNPPRNDDNKEIEIKYRINDESGKSLNKLKVKLYWYNTMADVPQYLWDILNDRTSQGVFLRNGIISTTESPARNAQAAKPRPPCIIIVGQ
jgi:hypothetical protein